MKLTHLFSATLLLLETLTLYGARPNLVLLVADDLGQRDLGCYGSTFYDTPNIDRLAREGARFTRAYAACPVCSPTRASLMTGKWPQRTGITDYIGAAQPAQWKRNTRHLPAPYADRLALEETTLAETLKSAGYATFFGGKWHLGPQGYWPEDQGFDVNRGGIDRGGPYGGRKYFSPYGNPRLADGPAGEHLPDRLATEAARFIEAHQAGPFLVCLPFYSVHTPLMAREDLRGKYLARRNALTIADRFGVESPRRVRLTQDHAVYAAMVEAMDAAVGKVVAQIDALGLSTNTLVIFTSDNGGLSTSEGSPTSNFPLRAGKGWLYEGGLRVPLIARWTGTIAPAGVHTRPISSPDFLPTLREAAQIPGTASDPRDGVSFLDLLRGSTTSPDRPLFWHYPHYGNQGGAPGAAILRWPWKLIQWFEDDRLELFRLDTDPSENTNVAGRDPARAAALQQELTAWQLEVGALRSTPNPTFDQTKPDGRN